MTHESLEAEVPPPLVVLAAMGIAMAVLLFVAWAAPSGQPTLLITGVLLGALFLAALVAVVQRTLFPYLLVLVLGLDHFGGDIGYSGTFTVPKLGAFVVLVAYVMTGPARRRRLDLPRLARLPIAALVPPALFAAYFGLSFLWGPVASGPLESVTLLLLLVLFIFIVHAAREPDLVRGFTGALVFYGLLIAALAVANVVPLLLGSNPESVFRTKSLAGNPNYGAFYMALATAFVLGVGLARSPGWRWLPRRAVPAALVLLLLGTLATASRGGMVAFAVGTAAALVASLFLEVPTRRLVKGAAMLGLAMAAAALFTPLWENFLHRPLQFDEARLGLLDSGWRAFLERPFLGHGYGSFLGVTGLRETAHNTYVWALVEGGALGLALWLWAVAASARAARPQWGSHALGAEFRIGIVGAFAAGLVFMFTATLQHDKLWWVLLATGAAAAWISAGDGEAVGHHGSRVDTGERSAALRTSDTGGASE